MNNKDVTITIKANASQFQAALDAVKKGMEGAVGSIKNGGSTILTFAKNASDGFSEVASGIMNVAKVAATTLVGGSFGAKYFVDLAGSLQTTQKQMAVLTGSTEAANKVFGELYNFTLGKPIAFPDASKAASTLLGYGRTVQTVQRDMETLSKLSIVNGGNLQNLAVVYGQVTSRGALFGQDALQLINNNIPLTTILAKKFGISMQEASEKINGGVVSADEFIDAMKGYADSLDISSMSDSFKNKMISLQGTIRSVGLAILGVRVDSQKGLIIDQSGLFARVIKLIESFTGWLKENKQSIIDVSNVVINNLVPGLTALAAAFAVMKIGQFAVGIVAVVSGFKQFTAALQVGKGAMAAMNAVTAVNPFVIIATAVALLIAGITFLVIKFDLISKAADAMGGVFRSLEGFLQSFVAKVVSVASNIGDAFSGAWDSVKSAWGNFSGFFSGIISAVSGSVSGFANKVGGILSGIAKKVGDKLSPVANIAVNAFRPIGKKISDIFSNSFSTVSEVIRKSFGDVIASSLKALSPLRTAFEPIKNAWNSALSPIFALISQAFNDAKEAIKQNLLPAINDIKEAFEKIKTAFNPLIELIKKLIVKYAPQLKIVGAIILGVLVSPLLIAISVVGALVAALVGIGLVFAKVLAIASPIISTIVSIIGGAIGNIIALIEGTIGVTVSVFSGIATIIGGIVSGIVIAVSGTISALVSTITGVISGIINIVAGIMNVITGIFTLNLDKIKDGFVSIFGGIGQIIVSIFTGVVGTVISLLGGIGSFLVSLWNGTVKTFVGIGTAIGNAIWGIIRGSINGVASLVEGVANTFINAVNAVTKIINKIPGVNIGRIGPLSIPRMATGGILGGNSYNGDKQVFAGNTGEMVINRQDQSALWAAIKSGNFGSGQSAAGNANPVIQIMGALIDKVVIEGGASDFTDEDAINIAKRIVRALRAQGLSIEDMGELR